MSIAIPSQAIKKSDGIEITISLEHGKVCFRNDECSRRVEIDYEEWKAFWESIRFHDPTGWRRTFIDRQRRSSLTLTMKQGFLDITLSYCQPNAIWVDMDDFTNRCYELYLRAEYEEIAAARDAALTATFVRDGNRQSSQ